MEGTIKLFYIDLTGFTTKNEFFLKKVQKSVDNEKIVWYINFALEKRSARSSLKTK